MIAVSFPAEKPTVTPASRVDCPLAVPIGLPRIDGPRSRVPLRLRHGHPRGLSLVA
jgi:hypothetical protein